MEEKKVEEKTEELIPAENDEPQRDHYSIPWKGFLIVFGILLTLIIACVIVILCNGGFYQW